MTTAYDVIVIGAGITGLTASKHLAHAGVSVANVEGNLFGGLVTNINELEGMFSGSGADLAATLMMEIGDLGCASLSESVRAVRCDGGGFVIETDAGEHRAQAVVVASGATLRRLGVPGEAEYAYKGVSQCADCDGPMFRDQDVVVVGGGDSALQEALVLADYCARVHVVHRGSKLSARPHWIEALQARDNVTVIPHAAVTAIEGGTVVERVRLQAGAAERTMDCAGVFAYIGLAPAAAFLPSEVGRDPEGAVMTPTPFETTLPGVFAAGAVRAGYKGTLADAVSEAELAAKAVIQHLRAGVRT